MPWFTSLLSLTLVAIAASAAEGPETTEVIKPEQFSGLYQFVSAETSARGPGSFDPAVQEIQIEVEKSTNTLYLWITKSKKSGEVGAELFPAIKDINGTPKVERRDLDWGCEITTESALTDETSVQYKVRVDGKLFCSVRTKRREEILQIRGGTARDTLEIVHESPSGKIDTYQFLFLNSQ